MVKLTIHEEMYAANLAESQFVLTVRVKIVENSDDSDVMRITDCSSFIERHQHLPQTTVHTLIDRVITAHTPYR